jgi:hypothetical protein
MTDTLNAALQELQQALSANASATTVIGSEVLDSRFHGLTLRQLVLLTQAPVLAIRSFRRAADGSAIEQFSIDGRDEDRCELAGRDLILAGQTEGGSGAVREVRIVRDGAPEHSLVLDRNDIVYRVTEQEAIVDSDLTAEVRARRQAAMASQRPASATDHEPIVINDGFGFRGIAGQVLHGLSAVRARNGIAMREIERLVRTSGEQTLEGACRAATPDTLLETFGRIVTASRQIDALLEAIGERARMMLSLVEPAAGRPGGGREPAAEQPLDIAPNPGFSIEGVRSIP